MTTVPNSSTERQQYRALVAALADKARATLPESGHRVDYAVKLVLAGDVRVEDGGEALVGSATDPLTTYHVNGTCECRDFAQAPGQWCQHRIARALAIRLGRMQPPAPVPPLPAGPLAPLPEMPFSVTLKGTIDGQDALLTARGQTPAEFRANLDAIRGLLDPAAPAAPADTPQCPHGHGALKKSTKGKGWYCTTKRQDGTWCPGR